jgi:hypothetical protein
MDGAVKYRVEGVPFVSAARKRQIKARLKAGMHFKDAAKRASEPGLVLSQ